MQRRFKKIFDGAVATWLILITLTLTPHFYTVIAALLSQESAWDLSSSGSTGEMIALEAAGEVSVLILKTDYKLVFACCDRLLAGARLISERAMQFDEDKIFAGIAAYLLHNDLRYNIPSITYRQPLSEHSSEG